MMDTFRLDLTYASRALRRTPAFTITAVLILALGIGLSSAMFTVFETVLLKKMPVRDQERLVELSGVARGAATEFPVGVALFHRYRDHTRTLQRVAGIAHWRVLAGPLTDGDHSIVLREAVVTEEFFQVLGAVPALGRFFRQGDERQWGGGDAQQVDVPIVLSYGAWRRAFGGDSSVIGHHLKDPKIDWTLTIVGVAPPGLDYPRGVEYWLASRYEGLDLVGRLTPGATPQAARAEFLGVLNNDPDLSRAFGARTIGAQVHTLAEMVRGDVQTALLVMTAAVALLLLLACANVGNLLLLRAAGRVREMAVRRALGATAVDLVRQLLTESMLVALAGGVLGVALARVLLGGLLRLAPPGFHRWTCWH